MLFYLVHLHSREKRPAVKVNLLDVSRFNVIGWAAGGMLISGKQAFVEESEIWLS